MLHVNAVTCQAAAIKQMCNAWPRMKQQEIYARSSHTTSLGTAMFQQTSYHTGKVGTKAPMTSWLIFAS